MDGWEGENRKKNEGKQIDIKWGREEEMKEWKSDNTKTKVDRVLTTI